MKQPFLLFKKIKEARMKAGFSQYELAQKLGLSDKTISAYELGRAIPPAPTIARIAQETGFEIGEFFPKMNQGKKSATLDQIDQKMEMLLKELQKLKKELRKND